MAYFTEISDYKTYSGKKDDLHFSYNANSGGGQAFLQGSFIDANGNLVPSPELNGREAVFRIEYADDNKATQRILINDDTSKYKIIPRGGDSNNVKFTVDQKTNPSKLIASFFMLPSTGLVKKSRYPNSFPFCCNNYWLQSMWFYAETVQQEIVYLTPRDCIFGCCDVENENIIKYFSFDINKRITDIIQFANYSASFDDEIASCLKLFADIYQGKREYAYKDCDNAVKRIMDYLVRKYPEAYSGFSTYSGHFNPCFSSHSSQLSLSLVK